MAADAVPLCEDASPCPRQVPLQSCLQKGHLAVRGTGVPQSPPPVQDTRSSLLSDCFISAMAAPESGIQGYLFLLPSGSSLSLPPPSSTQAKAIEKASWLLSNCLQSRPWGQLPDLAVRVIHDPHVLGCEYDHDAQAPRSLARESRIPAPHPTSLPSPRRCCQSLLEELPGFNDPCTLATTGLTISLLENPTVSEHVTEIISLHIPASLHIAIVSLEAAPFSFIPA